MTQAMIKTVPPASRLATPTDLTPAEVRAVTGMDADRERSSRCAVGDVRRASVASRSPALPPPRRRSRAGVLGGVTAGAAVLSCGV
jgi:hypothetical protein